MSDKTQIELVKISRRLDAVETDVAILKEDVSTLKTDVSVLKVDMADMKKDMTHMRGQIDVIVGLLSKALALSNT